MDGRFFEIDARLTSLREKQNHLPRALVAEFGRRLEISWIYHDCALEGVVLSYSEIKAAIDRNIISDVSLIPSYEELKSFKTCIEFAYETAENKKRPINLETIRKIYSLLAPDEVDKGIPFRKDNPLHRLYYHEISQPDKIAYRMRKLGDWLEEDAARRLHPIERAARAHFKLMSVYPWTKNSGRVARVLSNIILIREGYLPAIVHSIDRQRYYEALRAEHAGIIGLYLEATSISIESAQKFYAETEATQARRRLSAVS